MHKTTALFGYKTGQAFPLKNNPIKLYLSYKTDLDFIGLFLKVKLFLKLNCTRLVYKFSVTLERVNSQYTIRQRKERDGLLLSLAVPSIQWDSNPTAPRLLGYEKP